MVPKTYLHLLHPSLAVGIWKGPRVPEWGWCDLHFLNTGYAVAVVATLGPPGSMSARLLVIAAASWWNFLSTYKQKNNLSSSPFLIFFPFHCLHATILGERDV